MELISTGGYHIFCDEYMQKNAALTVIAMHGIGGSRKSTAIARLQQRMQSHQVNLIAFDWPAHGESDAPDGALRVSQCLDDLKRVYDYVKRKNPEGEIIAFSTSFGAYLTLLFQLLYPRALNGLVLRSPAISLYRDMEENILSREQLENLRTRGCCDFGYSRTMKLSAAFMDDLRKNDILKLYQNHDCSAVDIIHGSEDTTAPMKHSAAFCEETGASLYVIEGAGHRFTERGQLDEVIGRAEKLIEDRYLRKSGDGI